MTYTQLALSAVVCAVAFDIYVFKTRLVLRRVFWTSYAIIIAFQLLTNWWLTSRNIVMYDPAVITGIRIAAAPAEDLLFGFALVLGVLSNWIRLGALDKQR
jgi:lycopene cyclase domain-containing protein